MREPREYIQSDWVDETIDGMQELSDAVGDSVGIMQLYFFKAQLDILDGMRLATQRYVDFLERRYGGRDTPMPGATSPGRVARPARRGQRERLTVEAIGEDVADGEDGVDDGADESPAPPSRGRAPGAPMADAGPDSGGPVVFRAVEPQAPSNG